MGLYIDYCELFRLIVYKWGTLLHCNSNTSEHQTQSIADKPKDVSDIQTMLHMYV